MVGLERGMAIAEAVLAQGLGVLQGGEGGKRRLGSPVLIESRRRESVAASPCCGVVEDGPAVVGSHEPASCPVDPFLPP